MSTASTRGFWPLRDLPVVMWLALLVLSTLVHQVLPAPRWLMIHLLLLGAVSHAILVWSQHFANALLHAPRRDKDRRRQSWRLILLNAGVAAVLAGVAGALWPVTVAGATTVVVAVVWHGADLFGQLRRALPSQYGFTVRYYVAAACFLPIGAALGTALAHGFGDPTQEQVTLAHAAVNLLGWMGLTIAGTVVTLWPTMLRTRIAAGADRAGRRALPVLVAGIVVTAGGAVVGVLPVVAAGLLAYLVGLGLLAGPMLRAARAKPPLAFPTWSVAAGLVWWLACLAALAAGLLTAPDWAAAAALFGWLTPFLAAGFGAQVLLGALSFLVPVALGGGPRVVRTANTVLDRGGALRIVLVNAGLLVCVLPVPSVVRVLASFAVLGGLAAFLPLLFMAIKAVRVARPGRREGQDTSEARPGTGPEPSNEHAAVTATDPGAGPGIGEMTPVAGPDAELAGAQRSGRRRGPRPAEGDRPRGQRAGQAMAGLAVVVLAVATGVAVDPLALNGTGAVSAAAGASATGGTTTVQVEARDMRFFPSTIEVPAGDRLVIELHNTDDADVHDLVLDSGADSGRLSPGQSTVIDVGVIGRDVDGWCSVVGHRQMGMVLAVRVTGDVANGGTDASTTGAPATPTPDSAAHAGHVMPNAAPTPDATTSASALPQPDMMASPGADFTARDATLPPLPPGEPGRVHRETFSVTEHLAEVAPNVEQQLWTFNGTAPGPVLHGRVGDVFEITLVNDGTIGHSIDFHAGSLAPDEPMRTIPPGESLVYRFTATMAGVWMYHCSTMPMSAHIANGLFGMVVIEPPDLPPVDRSYVLTQSELYLGPQGGPVDIDKLTAERPDLVVFNGYANQYDHRPLAAAVGERVRVWLLDAGPNRTTSFHVVGGQFDTVWKEGAYLLDPRNQAGLGQSNGGSQSLSLAPAQGGFVELEFPEPGHYPFVSHVMVDAERGAHGVFDVTG